MTSTVEAASTPLKLRALDPDLPMLAARAAMELDNYKLSGEVAFEAVRELSARLKNSFASNGTGAARKTLLDSGTVSMVGHALNTSRWVGRVSTIEQLGNEVWEIAQKLENVESAPQDEPIERIRDFCVALSKCAASYRQGYHDLRPSHPFRR